MPEQLPHSDYTSPYYCVVKQHSGVTAQKTLWRLMSRKIRTIDGANDWMNFCRSEEPKTDPDDFFIVTVYDDAANDWVVKNERRIYKAQFERMHKSDFAMIKVETIVDKIRYAMDHGIQNQLVLELLDMFDEESGKYKHE